MSSPIRGRDKLSLRKRLFVKKSTRVGCADTDSSDEPSSRPLSPTIPSDPFLARTSATDLIVTPSEETRRQCFRRCRPQSLIEGLRRDRENEAFERTGGSENCVYDVPIASVRFPPADDNLRKYNSFDHSNSFDKSKNNLFVKRLSVDHLITNSDSNHPRATSPENGRSCSLDRKRRGNSTITRSSSRAGSTDSLARHSLLAAQVLRLIPTQEARERNFLYGRLASNSLLGAAELEHVFPNREVRIFVGTWNMNGQSPPRELNDFVFPNGVTHVPDIFAIGTQESYSERMEWEVSLQEVLGPSHLLLHSATLGTLHLSIFIRRDLIWFCSLPEDASLSVRPGTAFRTKGAVAISFALFGSTFLFVTAHLTAHQEKVKERVSDIKRIIRALDLPKNIPCKHKSKDVTNNFDYVFWCGDLNFRLGEPRAAVLRWIEKTKFPLPPHLPHGLLHADQLTAVLADGAAFRDFREAPITFPPTYKYDPGSQQFDTSSKQRAPAYTDRILFKTKSVSVIHNSAFSGLRRSSSVPVQQGLKCSAYNSVASVCTSDHKPVWALFTASLRPGTDVVPLAAGLFNREVYLEGIKRRAAILDHEPGTSAVCSLQ